MTRTHHASRTWRLSCGCLRDYPGMPLGRVHDVLCIACNLAVTTEYHYPEQRCGYTSTVRRAEDGKPIKVSCTNEPGNNDCGRGVHYDKFVFMRFEARGRLRAANEGRVSRA